SYQSDASTQKGTLQDLTSRSYQEQSTIDSTIESLRSQVQGIQQSERTPL
ncbi:MAG: hypothetical protein JSS09_08915, partial [Verrucomicrobia bacterium]|nr:hypothetical protein [Verrucomicrobiota bacterium]